jgi:hypothetical protein
MSLSSSCPRRRSLLTMKEKEDTRRHRGNELIRCDASPPSLN